MTNQRIYCDRGQGERLLVLCVWWVLFLATVGGLIQAVYEGVLAKTQLLPLSVIALVLEIVFVSWGIARLPVSALAFSGLALLAGQVFTASLWFDTVSPPAFLLAGRGADFWSLILCALDVFIVGALLVPLVPGHWGRALVGISFGYGFSGFIAALFQGSSLEVAVAGLGFPSHLPLAWRPVLVAMNGLVPLGLAVLGIRILSLLHARNYQRALGIGLVVVLSLMPLGSALMLMTRLNIPNISWVWGHPQVKGEVEWTYTSPWNHAPDGSCVHRVGLRTPGTIPRMKPNWNLRGSMFRTPAKGEETSLLLAVRHSAATLDVLDLNEDELILTENGVRIRDFKIESVSRQGFRSNKVVLVVDGSEIRGEAPQSLRKTVTSLMNRLKKRFHVGLVLAGGTTKTAVGFTSDPSQDLARGLAAVARLEPSGRSVLPDSIYEGFRLLASAPPATPSSGRASDGWKAMVVLSHSPFQAVRRGAGQVLSRAAELGLPVFTVARAEESAQPRDARTDGSSRPDMADELACVAGGRVLRAKGWDEYAAACDTVAALLESTHRITYKKALLEPPTVRLDVSVEGASGVFEAVVRAGGGPLGHLELLVDGDLVQECATPECRFRSRAGQYRDGQHRVKARAVGRDGDVAECEKVIALADVPPRVEVAWPDPGALVYRPANAWIAVHGGGVRAVDAWIDSQTVTVTTGPRTGSGIPGDPDTEWTTRSDNAVLSSLAFAPASIESSRTASTTSPKGPSDQKPPWIGRVILAPGAMGPGVHRLLVRAADQKGRCSESSTWFKAIIPSIHVSLPGLSSRAPVVGRCPLEAQVTAVPPSLPATSVAISLDRGPVTMLSRPPFTIDLDGQLLSLGAHHIRVRATNYLGFFHEITVPFRVERPGFFIQLPQVVNGATISHKITIVPRIVDESKKGLSRVEYRIAGRLIVADRGDFSVELDPAVHPPGLSRLLVRAIRKDGQVAESAVSLVLAKPCSLQVTVHARRLEGWLTAEEFDSLGRKVWLDGKIVDADRVALASASDSPLAVAVILDGSRRLEQDGRWPGVKEAARRFTGFLRPTDPLSVLVAGNSAVVACSQARDAKDALSSIDGSIPSDGRALYDSIAKGIGLVSQRGDDRRAVLVIAGGTDQDASGTGPGSVTGLDEAVALANGSEVVIHTVGLGHAVKEDGDLNGRVLRYLARSTGGTYTYIPGSFDLASVMRELADRIVFESRITILAPDLETGKVYPVKIEVGDPAVQLTYPPHATAR